MSECDTVGELATRMMRDGFVCSWHQGRVLAVHGRRRDETIFVTRQPKARHLRLTQTCVASTPGWCRQGLESALAELNQALEDEVALVVRPGGSVVAEARARLGPDGSPDFEAFEAAAASLLAATRAQRATIESFIARAEATRALFANYAA